MSDRAPCATRELCLPLRRQLVELRQNAVYTNVITRSKAERYLLVASPHHEGAVEHRGGAGPGLIDIRWRSRRNSLSFAFEVFAANEGAGDDW